MSYDGSVSLPRKLTDDESRELRITLLPYFHTSGDAGVEDVTDLLDYAFAMISNNQTVEYVVKELLGMEMEFCNEEVAHKVGNELSTFVTKLNKGEDTSQGDAKDSRVVSLKVNILKRAAVAWFVLSGILS